MFELRAHFYAGTNSGTHTRVTNVDAQPANVNALDNIANCSVRRPFVVSVWRRIKAAWSQPCNHKSVTFSIPVRLNPIFKYFPINPVYIVFVYSEINSQYSIFVCIPGADIHDSEHYVLNK